MEFEIDVFKVSKANEKSAYFMGFPVIGIHLFISRVVFEGKEKSEKTTVYGFNTELLF